ncbi:MAG: YkgJ family cysteine cluster protein [Nitrososphaeria archaeon]
MVRPVGWRSISSWSCIRCGRCCRLLVPVKVGEALYYQKKYGANVIEYFNKGFHLKKKGDGYCIFLDWVKGRAYCSIYHFRPKACVLYPFYIYKKPLHNDSEMAFFQLYNEQYYVYIDAECVGINRGYIPINNIIVNIILYWMGRLDFIGSENVQVLKSV